MAAHRVLIVRQGGLGDTLLLWPAINELRRQHPAWQIELMGYPGRCELLRGPSGVDRVVDVEGSGLHLMYAMEAEVSEQVGRFFGKFDKIVLFASAGDLSIGENLLACGAGEVHVFMPEPPEGERVHVAEHLIECFVQAGLIERPSELRAPPLPLVADGFSRPRKRGGVVLAPGSGSEEKNWPARHWAAIARRLLDRGLRVCLLEGPADHWAVEHVRKAAGFEIDVISPATPIELAGSLLSFDCFVGNDSGPTHLAAMLHLPVVAVFGPTDERLWMPLGPFVEVVRAPSDCYPCLPGEGAGCSERACLEAVAPESVLRAVEDLLGKDIGASEHDAPVGRTGS